MGPISAVNPGTVGAASSLQPNVSTAPTGAAGASAGSSRLNPSGTLTGSQAVMNIHSAVSQLLQSVGGGIENDKALRALLVALILLALLAQQQQQGGDPASEILARLGGGSGDRSQFVGIFTSSTTISIQQTSTTIIMGAALDPGGASAEVLEGAGGQVDVAA